MSDQRPIDYHRVFRDAPSLFLLLAADEPYTIVDASDAYLSATYTTREQLVGRGLFEVFSGSLGAANAATMANMRSSLDRVLAEKTVDVMTLQKYDLPRPDGTIDERYWRPVNTPVLSDTGAVEYVLHAVENATELLRAEQQRLEERARLVEANNQFQAVYDQGMFAARLDLEGTVFDANRSCLETCGFTRDDVMGKPFWECAWWNRSTAVMQWVRDGVMQAVRGDAFRGESQYFWADGSVHVVDFACMPVRDGDGTVQFVVPVGMDITDRVQTNKDLRATEILESITEGFFSLDTDWKFVYVNREAERMLGRSQAELVGQDLWEAFPGVEASDFGPAYRRAMRERIVTSVEAYYADFDRWYDVHIYPVPSGLAMYFRDVSEERRSAREREQLVAESERLRRMYETALSNTPDFVYVFGLNHQFIYANRALLTMWGTDSAAGKSWAELGYEQWHAEMHDREIEEVIATRAPIRGEVPFTGTHGRRIYDYIFVPVFGADGEVVAVAGTTRDVTDRQAAEQAIREQAARLSEADRAKDEFLATLSHELRNPLAPLRNSLAVLRLASEGGIDPAPIHAMMERQVNQLVRLVDDLLEMSRVSRGQFDLRRERVAIGDVVRSAVETSMPVIERGRHTLRVHIPAQPVHVFGDPVRLSQVLANLLNNAAMYTDDGGSIALDVALEGERVAVTVRDNGAGISEEMQQRMFQMFTRGAGSRTKAQGGLGIGLALARRLADMHDGTLLAESDGPGTGSAFTLRLPIDVGSVGDARAVAAPAVGLAAQRMLVVDDNADAANSLAMLLRHLGADVEVATDGKGALDQFALYEPDVVLLDIGMPGMDGYEVARTLRSTYPARRPVIVALTGWGQEGDRRLARDAGFDHHLIKPADIGALSTLLASLTTADAPGD